MANLWEHYGRSFNLNLRVEVCTGHRSFRNADVEIQDPVVEQWHDPRDDGQLDENVRGAPEQDLETARQDDDELPVRRANGLDALG